MNRAFALLAIFFILRLPAFAGGGSNYTIFGIGDIRSPGSVRTAGMGFAGIATGDGGSINLASPATWSRISNTRIEAGFLYEGFDATDGSKSLYLAATDFNGASMAVPISTDKGVVFVAAFAPYSNRNYDVITSGSQQGIEYTLRHLGTGSIGRAQAGLSYSPFRSLSVGSSFNYLFGSLENSQTFEPTSTEFSGGTSTATTTTRGATVSLGAAFSGFGEIAPELQPLSLGFVLTSRGILDTESQVVYNFESEADSSASTDGQLIIPFSYGIGASYRVGSRWFVAADVSSQLWGHSPLSDKMRNSSRYSFGVEWMATQDPSASFLDRTAYRMGVYYHPTYYNVNGRPINEWGITGGFGIPISGESHLNLAIEYARRGETTNNLIEEGIIRFSASVTISEPWFIRFEED